MIIMHNMDSDIKWVPTALSEEEALASFAVALESLSKNVQTELQTGSFDREKAKMLMELLTVVIREYNLISLTKETLH